MVNDISYNQLISLRGVSVKCQSLLGSRVFEGKLILVFGNNKKTIINGKSVEATGQKKRIREIVSLAVEKGFGIPEMSIKHYAKDSGGVEYVLVRW